MAGVAMAVLVGMLVTGISAVVAVGVRAHWPHFTRSQGDTQLRCCAVIGQFDTPPRGMD